MSSVSHRSGRLLSVLWTSNCKIFAETCSCARCACAGVTAVSPSTRVLLQGVHAMAKRRRACANEQVRVALHGGLRVNMRAWFSAGNRCTICLAHFQLPVVAVVAPVGGAVPVVASPRSGGASGHAVRDCRLPIAKFLQQHVAHIVVIKCWRRGAAS